MSQPFQTDVIIIGGSYAGLSAAMALGRSLKHTLVIDEGKPCNASTPHSHNFLTHDGRTPAEISKLAREQVARYDRVQFLQDKAISGKKTEAGFEVRTQSGQTFVGQKLVIATGIKDLLPEIQGYAECWGISAIHCPYCHGYEYRGKATGILANGEMAFHVASLVRNLTDSLSIFTQGPAEFTHIQLEKLERNGIHIVEQEITQLLHEKGYLHTLLLKDGSATPLQALYTKPPFVQQTDIPLSLGCAFTEQGYIQVDHFQKTTVPGVFACGDNSSMMRSVANAVSTGNFVGAVLNKELTEERF